jgi:RNA polymerase sigma factor (sigma-70 family)
MVSESSTTDGHGRDLLARLSSPEAGAAWQHFLESYSSTIMLVASQFESHADRRNDCYLYVCERLCDDNFRRLMQYNPDGIARFRSWLKVVVTNLCIDFKRQAQGRSRPYRSIEKLSPLDQAVFKYKFQQRMNLSACLGVLKSGFPGLTAFQLALAVQRINEALTTRQQWLLSTAHPRFLSIDESAEASVGLVSPDQRSNPEQTTMKDEEHDRLERALRGLQPQQRLLLKLRYQQELTLREIARLARLGDPFKARREIQKALKALETLLEL